MKYIFSILLLTACVTQDRQPDPGHSTRHLQGSCPNPVFINVTPYEWNDFDEWSIGNARKECRSYYRNSPCLKMFRKYTMRDYDALCGR